ncbi:MAG: sulfur carrier protein ThiS [Chloroflexota bacterium]
MISVVINGKDTQLERPMTMQEYLEQQGLAERRLAIAVNGEIVRQASYSEITINHGDEVEIVRPVGGGQTRDANG